MVASRTHRLVALSIVALGVGVLPRTASASQCECTSTEQAAMSPACSEAETAVRCDTVEDCTSIVPFSREVRLDVSRFERTAPAPRSTRLSWCEGPNDPQCSESEPDRRPTTHVAVSAACAVPDIFVSPAHAEVTSRSTTRTAIVPSLASTSLAHRLDRPPR